MNYDVAIIGAGAAGLMCAITAAKRGRKVILLDHSNKIGKKILISGGGRCNFTHLNTAPENYLSSNPHFCISALKRYTPYDFLGLVKKHGVEYHEKAQGQLFCDHSSKDIVQLLERECEATGVDIHLKTTIHEIKHHHHHFQISSTLGTVSADSLVIATGGLSFPTMGASPFGYKIAEQFGHSVLPVRAGLVPLTLNEKELNRYQDLSGISIPVIATIGDQSFKENLLFTHRGLSGPAILQISSYWRPHEELIIDWLAGVPFSDWLAERKKCRPKSSLKNNLAEVLTHRVANRFAELDVFSDLPLNQLLPKHISDMAKSLNAWSIKPNGTEGYRTAEVTLGGIDTNELSSKTMMSKKVEGLYFIGEVVDVTGQLGGYNFQWAWSSGYCAGQFV